MQQQHYILALGALWIFTLAFLPFLFAKARRRAYEAGHTAGLDKIQAEYSLRIKNLTSDLDNLALERAADQKKFAQITSARLQQITELEARIMSYTGLAVSKIDYEQLTKAAETLRLAQRTWETAKGTEPLCVRAHNECRSLQSLAKRIHDQLRNTPTSSTKAGETA
ncbi:hypothetical protein NVV94_18145 [Pseudomonas sp. LS1212]|uniref:hypothetical protein n=1 Tax=Pseudomonas sp. LS1212 TaxID=2972478 RepID=UPI00215D5D3C|nr:hypothetical protein [Pseudomonas sp. LS1212]UVJ42535.1 hypothetical protein NVV94_18145 [Pseudomonas sp. LS1212]